MRQLDRWVHVQSLIEHGAEDFPESLNSKDNETADH